MTKGDPYKNVTKFKAKRVEAKTPCGTMFIIGNYDYDNPDKLIQTHVYLNKSYNAHPCMKCLLEGISRLVSLCLRRGIPISAVIEELSGLRCNYAKEELAQNVNVSCCHAFANALRRLRCWNHEEKEDG